MLQREVAIRRKTRWWLVTAPMALFVMTGHFTLLWMGIAAHPAQVHLHSHKHETLVDGCAPNDIQTTVARKVAEAWFADANTVARSARVVPAMRNGRPIGFKLYAVRPGSPYEAIGLRNGDLVRRVAGIELTEPDKALVAYARMKEAVAAGVVLIELERNGCPMTIEVTLID